MRHKMLRCAGAFVALHDRRERVESEQRPLTASATQAPHQVALRHPHGAVTTIEDACRGAGQD